MESQSDEQKLADGNPYASPERVLEKKQKVVFEMSVFVRTLAAAQLVLVIGATAVTAIIAVAALVGYVESQSTTIRNVPLSSGQLVAVIVLDCALFCFLLFLVPRCIANLRQPTFDNERIVTWSILALLTIVACISGVVAVWPGSGLESSDVFLFSVIAWAAAAGVVSAWIRIVVGHINHRHGAARRQSNRS